MKIRSYRGTDEFDLLNVWQLSMTHDPLSSGLFHTRVLLDPNFQAENLVVAEEDGHIVGFVLALTRQVPLFLQGLEPEKSWITAFGVHPDYRRRGIGRALFTHVLDRFKEQGRKTVEISPYVPNYFIPGVDSEAYRDALAFLQGAFGFSVIERPISMGAKLTGFQIPTEIIQLELKRQREDDLWISPVTSADLPELMPFISTHFGWDWYRHLQEYLLEYFGDSSSQMCILVARLRGEIVGFCPQRRERFGPFGVRGDVRNLGIGRILLFRCLAEMSKRNIYYSYFMWTGDDAARLYSQAGYEKRRTFAILRKDLV